MINPLSSVLLLELNPRRCILVETTLYYVSFGAGLELTHIKPFIVIVNILTIKKLTRMSVIYSYYIYKAMSLFA